MIRILILFLCFMFAFAYPPWFHKYIEEHDKKYTVEEMIKAYSILKPKYDHIQKNKGGLHLRLHKNSDTIRKTSRRLHEMKKRSQTTPDVKKKLWGYL